MSKSDLKVIQYAVGRLCFLGAARQKCSKIKKKVQ